MTETPSSVEEVEEEEYQLTPDESERFKVLVQVGALTDVIDVFGHKILISTLSVAEDLEVGLLLKDFNDTHAFQRAYKTLIAAASVREIDGRPLATPLGPFDNDRLAVAPKFEKIKEYYPAVIDMIYSGVQELEKKLLPVLSRLGKTSA